MLGLIRRHMIPGIWFAEYEALRRFWRFAMRWIFTLCLVSGMAFGQAADSSQPASSQAGSSQTTVPAAPDSSQPAAAAPAATPSTPNASAAREKTADPNARVIPAGARIPL